MREPSKRTSWMGYRPLKEGEIVLATDESLHESGEWRPAQGYVGKPASDPKYPAHCQFRRRNMDSDLHILTDEELQDEIDTFSHVCRHLGQFKVKHTEKTDATLDRLERLEEEQRRRKI